MNLNFFCDPDASQYPIDRDIDAFDCIATTWTKIRVKHPVHEACSGKAIVGWGKDEQIVDCECLCHPPNKLVQIT